MALSLRSPAAADVEPIAELLHASRPVFSDVECHTAIEMFREGLARPEDEDAYQLLVAEDGGRVLGYTCFGSIPLTAGAYDLYWIAVAPDARGRGIGRALLARTEERIARQGGRLVVVETSGRAVYAETRRFYEQAVRYECVARIRDFYATGDDKVVYVKYLSSED